mgnify:CR=1 FL=1
MTRPVLLLDDDSDVREAYGQTLGLAGYEVIACRALIEAVDHLNRDFLGVVVTDMKMPGRDGFDMLARVVSVDPTVPVIVLTGHGDVPMAVRAMRDGAFDFLEKPCPSEALLESVARAFDMRQLALSQRKEDARSLVKQISGETEDGLTAQMAGVEREIIEQALKRHRGAVLDVCAALDLPRKTLYDKLKRHGLSASDYR